MQHDTSASAALAGCGESTSTRGHPDLGQFFNEGGAGGLCEKFDTGVLLPKELRSELIKF